MDVFIINGDLRVTPYKIYDNPCRCAVGSRRRMPLFPIPPPTYSSNCNMTYSQCRSETSLPIRKVNISEQ